MEEQSCWGKLSPSVVYDFSNMGLNIPTLLIRSQYHMLRYLLYGQVWMCRFYRLLGFQRIRSRHFLSQSKQDWCWSFSSYLLRKSIGFKNDISKSGLGKVLIEIKSLSIEVRKKFSLCNCPDKISQISILLSIAARKWCRKLQFSWPEGRLIEYDKSVTDISVSCVSLYCTIASHT